MSVALRDSFSQPTWRVLGLSVAVGYAGLGSFAILLPSKAAEAFGLSQSTDSNGVNAVETSMNLLGARDLSIGVALWILCRKGRFHEMGVLILSGMILCVVDVVWVFKLRGTGWGTAFAVGAAIWAAIGVGLLAY